MWRELMVALVEENKPLIGQRALYYVYYWCAVRNSLAVVAVKALSVVVPYNVRRLPRYNFMPLARGTAAVGYLTLLAIFLAADMPVTTQIPKVPA